jgi:membrane fusion protein
MFGPEASFKPEERSALFRPEAVGAALDRMGSPVKPAGVASWILTGFMVTLLVVTITFLCLARYARRETVVGALQPAAGALRVSALRAGIIADVAVHEGQDVAAGQPLLTVTSDPTIADGRRLGEILSNASDSQDAALATQTLAQRELVGRQREALAAKRAALVGQSKRLISDVALQRERVMLAEQTAIAARALWAQQLISALQYRQREEALIVAKQGLSAIEREQAAIPSSLAELAAEDRRLLAQAQENDAILASSRAQLDEKRASTQAETRIVLTAQKAGQVAALQAKPGAPVTPGQALAFVLPRGVKLQAELWVPSRAAGFVRTGDKVRLMYDAFPYQRFGVGRGRVAEVAKAPTAPSDLPVPIQTPESLYRVVVDLDDQAMHGYGREWQLSPGMRLTADLVLEQQSLWAWLFDKIRAAQVRAEPI